MRLGIGSRCASSPYAGNDSNPDPKKFRIMITFVTGDYTILNVKYPNCTNFEGIKIMVFKGYQPSSTLDPHFSNTSPSPLQDFFLLKMAGIWL